MLLNLRSVFTYTVCIHIRICLPWVLSTHLCAESLFSWIVARLSPRASTQPRQRTYATHAYLCHLVPMVRVLESLRCGFLRFASSSIRFSCRRFLVLFLSFPLFWSLFFFFSFFFFFFFLYMFLHVLFAAWSCSARHSLRTALLHQWKRNRPWKKHVKRSQAQAAHRYLGTLTFTSHLACTSHPAARVWGSAQVRKSNKYFLREFPS